MLHLQDIADDLHISVSLVSKVLNGRMGTSGASPRTVRAIQGRAQELGYRKNTSAAALATGKHNVIGVFIHRQGVAGSGIIEAMVEGVAAVARERGQRLLLSFFDTTEEFRQLYPEMHRNVMDGVLVGGLPHQELAPELTRLQANGVPVVTIHDRLAGTPQIANVGMDQVEVGRLATAHLLGRGCRRIAHFCMGTGEDAQHRFEGYRTALTESGVAFCEELTCRVSSYKHEAGGQAMRRLLERGIEVDGVVAQSDQQAVAAIHVLLEAGRQVPGEVKVVGIDNSPFCDFSVVPLTSVSQENYTRGKLAMGLLMEQMAGKTAGSVNVEPRLYCRVSSGEVDHLARLSMEVAL